MTLRASVPPSCLLMQVKDLDRGFCKIEPSGPGDADCELAV
jgi:hypothetical protein